MISENEVQVIMTTHANSAMTKYHEATKEYWRRGATDVFRNLKKESEMYKYLVQVLSTMIDN
ncbi:MAG: hypothetical protein ACRKGH_04495 [Dehalogenimonas sp.]